MFRPASYFIEYIVNYDYIKEELCKNKEKPYLKCNGICYVESSLKSSNLLEGENSQKTIITKNTLFFPVFVLNEMDFSIKKVLSIKKSEVSSFSEQFFINKYINEIFRPPKTV